MGESKRERAALKEGERQRERAENVEREMES